MNTRIARNNEDDSTEFNDEDEIGHGIEIVIHKEGTVDFIALTDWLRRDNGGDEFDCF